MNNSNNPFKTNLIMAVDSYKLSHPYQYEQGSKHVTSYIESRGGIFDATIIAGVHFIMRAIDAGITREDVDHAEALFRSHFGFELFDRKPWDRIVDEFGGKLPVDIRAVPEGTLVPVKNVILTITNTHPEYHWLPSHLETFLLRAIWYPSTVATNSFMAKKVIKEMLEKSSDLTGETFDFVLKTRLHDFGARGVSSAESAAIGGAAHLINFIGTDTVEGMVHIQKLYNLPWDYAAGISIPAREHTTTISYGDDGKLTPAQEDQAYLNSIRHWGDKVYACVCDSVDFKASVDRLTTGEIRDEIINRAWTNRAGTFVIRPDSGDMYENVLYALEAVAKNVGCTVNSKGYKVLHPAFRVIQGDGIDDVNTIRSLYSFILHHGYSAENLAIGMGGGLLQRCNRDDQKWAMKASAVWNIVKGWKSIRKIPKGAEWKASKAGLLQLAKSDKGVYRTFDSLRDKLRHDEEFVLEWIISNGSATHILNKGDFERVRQLSDMQA